MTSAAAEQRFPDRATITVYECSGCGRRWVDAPGEHGRWLCRGEVRERTFVDLAAVEGRP